MNTAKCAAISKALMIENRGAGMPSDSGNSSTAPFAERGGRIADDVAVRLPAACLTRRPGRRREQQVPEYRPSLGAAERAGSFRPAAMTASMANEMTSASTVTDGQVTQ